ncbi:MAG: hypothetical protein MK234_07510 [Nitrospinales bacterium]|nr:hypothetical protein [Nitrospinales bacterium]
MFSYDPINDGLKFLASRDLEKAENMFLRVMNDPYARQDELSKARKYLNDIRACQSGVATLDFDRYKKITKNKSDSLDAINEILAKIYFSPVNGYNGIWEAIEKEVSLIISRLKQVKIRDVVDRDKLYAQIEKKGVLAIKNRLKNKERNGGAEFDVYRWKTMFRKLVEQINPFLLARHLELLDYISQTGEIGLLDDSKLTVLTPKYKWVIDSTVKNKWFLMRSYFFKARREIESQFTRKEATRKYWEEIKYKKIKIFEKCGFDERDIQKFLHVDKLNYNTLEEIYNLSMKHGVFLLPRDVSLALRGVAKSRDAIKERAGILVGARKSFQDELRGYGFSDTSSYQIAYQVQQTSSHKVLDAFETAVKVARDEIYWYRILPQSKLLKENIENQCCKHLSTVYIHMFERGRLNKLLLQLGKSVIQKYLIRMYGENVVDMHCYFRLRTIHQYYKLKYFEYHCHNLPSVSELLKISREDFKLLLVEGFNTFVKERRLNISSSLYDSVAKQKSITSWEDKFTTVEEKLLLKFWFLMDHGVKITQGLVKKGAFSPDSDLWGYVKNQGLECNN